MAKREKGEKQMQNLIEHFIEQYNLSEEEAEQLIYDSLLEFEVLKAVLKVADRMVNNVAS